MKQTTLEPKTKAPFYFDTEQFQYRKNKEAEAMAVANELISQAHKALGIDFKLDYIKLFDIAGEYISQTYYNTFSPRNFPIHVIVDFSAILLQDVGVNTATLNNLLREYNKLSSALGKYAPTITSDGITSNVRKEDFYFDLDKDKKEMYDVGVRLVESINKMASFYKGNGLFHLFQSKFFGLYRDDGFTWKLNKEKFI